MIWRCTGPRWSEGRPGIGWYAEQRGERTSLLAYGQRLAFTGTGQRTCLGVWRGGRRTPCPTAAVIPSRSAGAQCADCARLDRSFSVAADTRADDPRPYRVYLAWFGPGLIKVGITAEERGPARLLEQGAVTWTWLGRGPLMAARRTEELLRAALKVPDRIAYARKRTVRDRLPDAAGRAGEVAGLHERAAALAGWPETLERLPCGIVDHAGVFGLAGLPRPDRQPDRMTAGGTVAGLLVGAAGPDLHFADGLVMDARLLAGWVLAAAGPDAVTTVPVTGLAGEEHAEQEGLF
ncbi:DUF2797 domain-containing protein [Streptomyces venezuelae]|uniref:DUF2797 domain-containing protein n=1 Tax=Streptomyces venezuelae TaxID=54571 RepID=A0A5P2DCF9_STRVZ|nr:DUF2797 domain-containing protein [Streptomyces venezuelae]QES52443.1 DUF2797 domain-containing protein [Streptomyces venezuelae]